ncbi:hypothetical protein MPRM_07720 [Mycobacterium parmense]|uniref:Uncharacterized protein n=1 Tax=Mycobacterium parmense TaxID=185642 RepID=A0A7I7YRY2_9MYCO|nr:hypothetical protein MPRM_07720 [Mycobacterium parmense]
MRSRGGRGDARGPEGRDAVFAGQTALQADVVRHEPGTATDGTPVDEPFVTLDWTFTLAAE